MTSPDFIPALRGLVISTDPNGDGTNRLTLDHATVVAAAADPEAIGRLMVDMAASEGHDLTPCGRGATPALGEICLCYERTSTKRCVLSEFRTGMEDFFTGGWVRVLLRPDAEELAVWQQLHQRGLVTFYGLHRGVHLVAFDGDAGRRHRTAAPSRGFGKEVG